MIRIVDYHQIKLPRTQSPVTCENIMNVWLVYRDVRPSYLAYYHHEFKCLWKLARLLKLNVFADDHAVMITKLDLTGIDHFKGLFLGYYCYDHDIYNLDQPRWGFSIEETTTGTHLWSEVCCVPDQLTDVIFHYQQYAKEATIALQELDLSYNVQADMRNYNSDTNIYIIKSDLGTSVHTI